MEHKRRVQESILILTTYTAYHSRSIRRIQDFDELKDNCLTLKNPSYPHQRYAVYNTLVNEEQPTGFTSIRRIHQEDTAYLCPNFTKTSMTRILNTPYPEAFIRRIERRLMNIMEYYNHGAYAKYPNTPYPTSPNTAYRPFSRLYKYKTLNLVLVKAVEESCVTCGGAHSYRNCPSTDSNVYRDNIQEYVSQAAAANFNQGNIGYRAPFANQMRPPGFPLVQNQGNNQNRYNQNRGTNYNQGQIYRPPINQPPVHQALAPQIQGVSKDDFQNYVKANDAVMRNMQNQNQNLQNQMTNLTDMLSKFVNSNTASTSGSGTLPSNTITNPKVDLKGITTRSGVAYQGPTIPTTSSPPKVVERETEVTKDMVPPINNRSTKDVQPPLAQVLTQVPNSEPIVAPVSAPMPNPKPLIPYPSRLNDQKIREKANNQIEKFYQIFQDLHFKISFADALILMPKFASTLKSLIGNKEKLSEMARTPLNEHCSAVLLKKLPEKLGDPGKFLIPCDFPGMDECLALADLPLA
ncbi:hypothetical protein Tco_1068807 [Tanacetum coccineum]|uniref:Reverse transcriptase domain-containing protein n=1 Tax=Tanacetum coccineum TaxID=301880 RepID=A0ABQ5HIN5_9ASTR